MSWRPRHVTRWNRACSSILMDILREQEGKYLRRHQSTLFICFMQLISFLGIFKRKFYGEVILTESLKFYIIIRDRHKRLW